MFAPLITEPIFYFIAIPAAIFLGLAKGGFSGVGTAATPLLALYLRSAAARYRSNDCGGPKRGRASDLRTSR